MKGECDPVHCQTLDLCPTHTEGEHCDQTGLNSPAVAAADIIHWLCSDQPQTRHQNGAKPAMPTWKSSNLP